MQKKPLLEMHTRVRKVNKRGYVYIARACAGQEVEITIKPRDPEITAREV